MQANLTPVDIYGPIHRALRHMLAALTMRLGTTDPDHDDAVLAVTDDLDALLCFCRRHVEHEARFVHPLVLRSSPGAAAELELEHRAHETQLDALRVLADAVELPGTGRATGLQELYLAFARFSAETLRHLDEEETVVASLLNARIPRAELLEVGDRIMASMGPEEVEQTLRVMIPANPHGFRVGLLTQLRASAPAPAFDRALAACRPSLPEGEWRRLSSALGVAA